MDEKLDRPSVSRYSRQLIMPEIGVKGQLKLKNSKVLIVGAGGLGCPAAQYLAAGGVGTIGIVDYDQVETSNLHRQILHTEERAEEKWTKAESAAKSLQALNKNVKVVPHITQLDRSNAENIFKDYDIIVDATDNVASRYLISDVCVLLNKPLVSGSALRWEGQLTTYHYTDKNGVTGPCYRCLYPSPPPPEAVTNCSDGGVLGVVPGIIGCLQALETIKIIVGLDPTYHQKLYLFDGLGGASRTIKLRPRQKSCVCCGTHPSFTLKTLPNYPEFCGMGANDKCRVLKILDSEDRISVKEYKEIMTQNDEHILVDVRSPVELDICSLPDCVNVPIQVLKSYEAYTRKSPQKESSFDAINTLQKTIELKTNNFVPGGRKPIPIYVMCRQGNDSQIAVKILRTCLQCEYPVQFKDIRGGLMAWARQIDNTVPQY